MNARLPLGVAVLTYGIHVFILEALRRSSYQCVHPIKGPKKDDASLPTKVEQLQDKPPHSLKSKVTENIPPQSVKVVSKSKTLKGKATHVDNGVKSPLKTPKEANITGNGVIDVTLKRKKLSSSSDKSVENSLGIAPSRSNTSKTSISLHEIGICNSAASSSNVSSVSQELHWKRLKKKPKELNNQQCEFTELDSISIDTTIFEDGDAGSTMPLLELAHQVLLEEFFKKHRDYDVARLSTSQKITRDSHQELLSPAQQCLDTVNEERISMDKQLEELQKVLTRAKKEIKSVDFKEEENHLPY
ncbi:hypothetical protein KY289_009588 [Solanum tuberosum]|nr:hypothetical protein KY289_009588 [Solanum tuberosum]